MASASRPAANAGAVDAALAGALQHLQAGKVQQAQSILKGVLEARPNNPVVLHLLGVIALQTRRLEEAVDFIGRALALKPDYAEAHNNLGSALVNQGKHEDAAASYRKAIRLRPDYATAYVNLGVASTSQGMLDDAIAAFRKAIALAPNIPQVHNNLGSALKSQGKLDEAVDSFQKAVAFKPDYAEAHYNLGNAFNSQDKLAEAVASLQRAVTLRPDFAEAHNDLGNALNNQGRHDEAVASHQKAVVLKPGFAEAHNDLGSALKGQGKLDEAAASHRKAIALESEFPEAHTNLGIVLAAQGKLEEAVAALWKAAPLRIEQEWTKRAAGVLEKDGVTVSRLHHDIEQAQYLVNVGRGNVLPVGYLENLQEVASKIGSGKHDSADTNKVKLTPEQIKFISYSFKTIIHIHEARKVSSGALNPENDWEEIQARYIAADPKVIWIDNFLSGEALSSMQEFCLRSTIWKKEYENHYLGAFMDQGFVGPLHFQIAQELKEKLPILFGPHRLEQFWAFKYDSQVGSGINLHADFAELNLNFWVTPDSANLDENSGGLLVYDISPPEDWAFGRYNANQNDDLGKLMAEKSTKKTVIPYRANRAALFDSALVHESDEIHFRDGYENRRVNLTYLFGKKLRIR